MKNSSVPEYLGCVFQAVLTVVQTNEIFQLISLILTIISLLVTLSFTIWKWYRKAMEDGKIDAKEVEEAVKIITDGIEDIKDVVDGEEPHDGELNE